MRGATIADLVQQVFFAVYGVRLDVHRGENGEYHSRSDKFKEVVMEMNLVLQELQKEQDWNWLRDRYEFGVSENPHPRGSIQEFKIPDWVYKPCTGYNDGVRLHSRGRADRFTVIPWVSPRSGSVNDIAMFDAMSRSNVPDDRQKAFVVGDTLTFSRPWYSHELHRVLETDVIRRLDALHVCDDSCGRDCPHAYEDIVLAEIPDISYVVLKTAAYRAELDPSAADRAQSLADRAAKMLSAMRENDSAHTLPDTWISSELGFVSVL